MSDSPVAAGDVLAGKYRIDRVLGQGGMGVVVAATHEQLDQKVAIKFLLPQALANAEVVARFQREARAAVKIQSEHVARVIDVGTLASGAPYLVMEYLEGIDLAHRIAAGPPLAVAEAARFLLEACEALAEAHAAGIVHRDIKPANLFLAKRADKTSSVKVLDFGISKAQLGPSQGAITSTQAVMGSPYYMSPEQLMSAKHVDHRSDIWSLGIVFYEALVGSPPYLGDQLAEIVAKILQGDAPRVTPHRPDVAPEVDAIVARCLAKDPNGRFQDVGQLAAALAKLSLDGARSVDRISRILGPSSVAPPPETAPAVDSKGGTLAMARATPMPAASPASTSPGWGTTSTGIPPKRSALWIAAAGAGVLAVAAIAFAFSRGHDKPAAQTSSGLAVSAISPNIPAPPPLPSETLPSLAIAASAMSTASSTTVPAPTAPPIVTRPATTRGTPVASAKVSPTVASAAPTTTVTPTATAAPTSALHMGIK